MTTPLSSLLSLLDLEALDADRFRGQNTGERRPRVFGGQVAAQALMAAGRTTPGWPAHSLHAYFLRPGDTREPIDYEVQRLRDGRSFVTRLVLARQRGELLLNLAVQFHAAESGFEHASAMPSVPPAEACPTWHEWMAPLLSQLPEKLHRRIMRHRPIDVRPVNPVDMLNPRPDGTTQRFWCRADGELPDDPLIHQCVATYASDHTLLSAAMRPHGRTFLSSDLMAASLDHALWFHRPFRMDEWVLYDQESPAAFGARGLALGRYFTRDGRLVLSAAQEGLLRAVTPRS